MDRMLTRYVRALRAAGVEASPAEALDAARTLAVMGLHDRAALKTALGIVLAKSSDEKTTHDTVFDTFFSAPEAAAQAQGRASPPQPSADGADTPVAPADLTPAPPAGAGGPGGNGSTRADNDPVAALAALAAPEAAAARATALARAAAQAGTDDIRFETQVPVFAQRLLDRLGIQRLDARRLQLLEQHTPEAEDQAAALADVRRALYGAARQFVQQRFELYGRPATESFMTEVAVQRALGRLGPHDMQRMTVAVQRMARRLARRHSRRRRVELRTRLDLRRMLRANAGHGGVPFHVRFRQQRKDKPRLVALCDVSGSVAAYVRFLLLFLYALQGEVTDVRCFAFSSHLMDVGPALEQLPFDQALQQILLQVGGGSTDYGQALVDLQARHWDCIDRRTTVLVLGDGRNNHGNPRLDIFKELAARVRRVIWLCPEPEARWGTGDSAMLQYRPHCNSVTHCVNALDLEHAIDDALAAHG